MSKSHTRAPWKAKQDCRSRHKNPDGVFVGGEHPDNAWAIYGDCRTVNGRSTGYRIALLEEPLFETTDENVAANAHLIAAAPELLAAAKRALDWFNDYVDSEAETFLGCEGIATQLDAAITSADPDWVC